MVLLVLVFDWGRGEGGSGGILLGRPTNPGQYIVASRNGPAGTSIRLKPNMRLSLVLAAGVLWNCPAFFNMQTLQSVFLLSVHLTLGCSGEH